MEPKAMSLNCFIVWDKFFWILDERNLDWKVEDQKH